MTINRGGKQTLLSVAIQLQGSNRQNLSSESQE
jgi:Na+-transporting NADH:ubiquinone oxidoreductase subunit NqrA